MPRRVFCPRSAVDAGAASGRVQVVASKRIRRDWHREPPAAGGTHVELPQDGYGTEEQAEQSSENWQRITDGLRQ
jgi:hypothetical protein